jgi:uncharacterized membrane protein (Fun14 family)
MGFVYWVFIDNMNVVSDNIAFFSCAASSSLLPPIHLLQQWLSNTVLAVTPAATFLKTGFSTGFRIYQNRTLGFLVFLN